MAGKLGNRLMILSLARHARHEGKNYSYEPYVREINLWSELYNNVDIYTQIDPYSEKNKHSFATFKYDNINLKKLWIFPVKNSLLSRLLHILTLPFLTMQFLFIIHKYDLIHIRNSSFPSIVLGLIVRLFRKKSITKWAGGFGAYPGEPQLSKLDRKVAGLSGKHNKTLIYNASDKSHLVTFIPALMSSKEIEFAQRLARDKPAPQDGFHLVSIGRLHATKNFELIPEALHELNGMSVLNWHYHCIGDGDLMQKMRDLVASYNLGDKVTFHGAMKFNEAQNVLAKSHVLIMPGVLEGWPKPIAEGWAHNTFPLAANRGNIPDILNSQEKGLVFEPDAKHLAKVIQLAFNQLLNRDSINLKAYANELSLETFKQRLQSEIKSL